MVTHLTTTDRQGNQWTHIAVRAVDRWFVGVDLGQSTDPTAICVLNHRVTPIHNEWACDDKARTRKQQKTEAFEVRHLERLPLGMSYPQQIQRIADVLVRPPLNVMDPKLVIDETGVGRPVGDMLVAAGLHPRRITITAGLEVTNHGMSQHVPKALLISNLEARSHAGELRIAAAANDAAALKDELKDFKRKISEAGRTTYAARVGAHDDLVLCVAIALWTATQGHSESWEPLRV